MCEVGLPCPCRFARRIARSAPAFTTPRLTSHAALSARLPILACAACLPSSPVLLACLPPRCCLLAAFLAHCSSTGIPLFACSLAHAIESSAMKLARAMDAQSCMRGNENKTRADACTLTKKKKDSGSTQSKTWPRPTSCMRDMHEAKPNSAALN